MTRQNGAKTGWTYTAISAHDERQQLPLERDLDGDRRPQAPADDLCDPHRYWEIFSGTD